jgi:hypothetical protein
MTQVKVVYLMRPAKQQDMTQVKAVYLMRPAKQQI